MTPPPILRRTATLAAACFVMAGAVQAAEVKVVSSGGFAAAYNALAPAFEQATGDTLSAAWGPSMGETKDAVPVRLQRGEKFDVLIMVGYALDGLVKQGKVVVGSATPLARSGIGVVVKAGADKPDVSTVDGLRRALLAAPSIAYSDSASGVYIEREMFKKMGIEDQVRGKARMIPAEPVGQVVARGDAAIGFQQISELKPIKGIELVGPLPAELQQITVFSAGIPVDAPDPQEARALITFLASPKAAPAVIASGLEPMTAAETK